MPPFVKLKGRGGRGTLKSQIMAHNVTLSKSALILATTFAAGLLFVNVYNTLIDAVNWGSNIPASIQTARDYYKTVTPAHFFRVLSPVNQILTLLALVFSWKAGIKARIYGGLALAFAVSVDAFTFSFFYPRLELMFVAPIDSNIDALKAAWSEWTNVNWLRSLLEVLNLAFDFAALALILEISKPGLRTAQL